jgi:uncharacterized protein involved in response to NO
MTTFITLEEPRRAPARPPQFALWALGFRPFYLLASGFAALSIALWAAQFAGWVAHPYLAGPLWHAHEMLFGFTLAVVVGFLFTAGRNWSNHATPTGWVLAALAGLWVAGRVLVLTPWGWAAAVVNVAFPWAAAVALAIPFWKARNRRNYFFVGLLVLMGAASLAIHLAQLGVLAVPAWLGLRVALDGVLFIMAVMAGRVIPMFTNNGVPGAGAVRHEGLDRLALGSVLALLVADALQVNGIALIALTLAGAALHTARWLLWRPWKTLRVPLVWVLHAGYAWIPVHLALRAWVEAGGLAPTLATHALTGGAIGGLVIGMMTRTSRGHTGRPLRADGFDVASYGLVLLAGVVRVLLPLVLPSLYREAVIVSAGLWSAGFGLFAWRYWPVLSRSRVDGKPG